MVDIADIVPVDTQGNDESKQQPFIIPLHEPFWGTLHQKRGPTQQLLRNPYRILSPPQICHTGTYTRKWGEGFYTHLGQGRVGGDSSYVQEW